MTSLFARLVSRNRVSALILATVSVVAVSSCDRGLPKSPIVDAKDLETTRGQSARILVINPDQSLLNQARDLGLSVSGDVITEMSGPKDRLLKLRASEDTLAQVDSVVNAVRIDNTAISNESTDHQIMYLAKREFGLLDWYSGNPTKDGRNVVVGVMDDGISPQLSGLRTTTTGERKLLALGKNSTALDVKVEAYAKDKHQDAFYESLIGIADSAVYAGIVKEFTAFTTTKFLDLNGNGTKDAMALAVIKTGDVAKVCIDVNLSHAVDSSECFGMFGATGEFGYWDPKKVRSTWAEFDQSSLTVSLVAGEFAVPSSGDVDYDSHGEGVASVMAGHMIANRQGPAFDGVAPGAKIVSYDLSEPATNGDEEAYTTGRFLKGYEWLGQHGAEVINTSYSFFFYSAETQSFFNKAVAALITKYNFVMSFSAGNNGPGLGSFNRGLMYPDSSLVAGAYVSRDLDEYVHGVTGLPEEGRVVFYSSRGPAPDGGKAPTVISPLASLTHATPGEGYQGFNGTSSASPALAGLAAVLVSAIKQENLPVDPMAVTHAIRASGQLLPGVPFIDQGYGLPNITRAFELYKSLTRSERFAYVNASIGTSGGIFIKASQLNSDFETVVVLSGKTSKIQEVAKVSVLLIPTDMEASASWIKHPSHGAVSVGNSNVFVGFEKDDIFAALDATMSGELSAEIKVKSSDSGEILAIIPITVVDDRDLSKSKTVALQVGAEDGKRIHFGVNAATSAVELYVPSASPDNALSVMLYGSSAVKGGRIKLKSGRRYIFETPTKGWSQLAIVRGGGTALDAQVQLNLRPLNLALASQVTSSDAPMMTINNTSAEAEGYIAVLPARTDIFSGTKISGLDETVKWELPVPAAGTVWSRANLRSNGNISYASSHCAQWLEASDGSVVASMTTDGTPFEITDDHVKAAAKMRISCSAFEAGAKPTATIKAEWNVSIKSFANREDKKSWQSLATTVPVRLATGSNLLPIPGSIGTGVEIVYRVSTDGGEVTLGTIRPLQ